MPLTIETPMTTASAVSSARTLRAASPLRATPIIGRSPPRASRGSCARCSAARSRTMWPSARNSTRSAIAAACASWVTITVVWPSSSTDVAQQRRGSRRWWSSRGCRSARRRTSRSGARRARGRRRRAAAGRPRARTGGARGGRRGRRWSVTCSTHAGSGLIAGELERQHDVLGRREHREQVEELEDEPDVRRGAACVSSVSSRSPMSTPAIETSPEVGLSSPARMCISVDLPEPDGPITAVSRPSAMSSETPRRASTAVSPSP